MPETADPAVAAGADAGDEADFRIVNQGSGTGFLVTSNTNNAAGVLAASNDTRSGKFTFNGTTYATVASGSLIGGLTSYDTAGFSDSTVTDIVGATNTLAASATTASIRLNDPTNPTLTLTGFTLAGSTSAGAGGMGILVTPAMGATAALITGGTIAVGGNNELHIQQFNTGATLTIDSAVTGASANLDKSGPGTAIYSGGFAVNAIAVGGGIMELSGSNAFNSATSAIGVGNGATVRYSGTVDPVLGQTLVDAGAAGGAGNRQDPPKTTGARRRGQRLRAFGFLGGWSRAHAGGDPPRPAADYRALIPTLPNR